eukprot:593940-Prorocentrum_minimum.AAC.1
MQALLQSKREAQLQQTCPVCTRRLFTIRGVDEQLFTSLRYLLDHDGAADLALTFTADMCGHTVELTKGGAGRAVTDGNKGAFVKLLVAYRLQGCMAQQVCAAHGY